MDMSQFIKPEMAGFIAGIIVVLETIKQTVNGVLGKESPAWVWKIAVIVAGFMAALVDMWDQFEWRNMVVLGLTYAAGATLVYQTGKMVVKAPKENKGK